MMSSIWVYNTYLMQTNAMDTAELPMVEGVEIDRDTISVLGDAGVKRGIGRAEVPLPDASGVGT